MYVSHDKNQISQYKRVSVVFDSLSHFDLNDVMCMVSKSTIDLKYAGSEWLRIRNGQGSKAFSVEQKLPDWDFPFQNEIILEFLFQW